MIDKYGEIHALFKKMENNIQKCIDQVSLILLDFMVESSSTILISPLEILEGELN